MLWLSFDCVTFDIVSLFVCQAVSSEAKRGNKRSRDGSTEPQSGRKRGHGMFFVVKYVEQ